MRILGTTIASRGHVAPMRPLLEAARDAGHDVVVVVSEAGGGLVGDLPVRLAPAPSDEVTAAQHEVHLEALRLREVAGQEDADLHFVEHGFGHWATVANLATVREAVADLRPDVVLTDPFHGAGLAVAAEAGLPVALANWCLRERMWRFLEVVARGTATALGPDGDADALLAPLEADAPWFTPFPPLLEPGAGPDADRGGAMHRWRIADPADPAELRADLAARLDADGRPVVYATLGSVVGQIPPLAAAFVGALAGAVADLDVQCVLTVGDDAAPGLADGVPGNVHVESFVAHRPLMARSAVVVSHGGMNTVMDAAAAGVPQVTLPMQSSDQRWTGRAIEAVGVGPCLDGPDLGAEALRRAIAAAVAGAGREPAAALAAALAALPGPAEVVGVLEDLVAR